MSRTTMILSSCLMALMTVGAVISCEKPATPPRGLITTESAQEQVKGGLREFSFNIFRAVSADIEKEVATNLYGKNFMISPFSLAVALAMTEGGAEGETAKEMKDVLGFSGVSQEELAAYFKELSNTLQTADSNVETSIANSIWSDTNFPVKDSFINFSGSWYDATIRTRDFKQASTADEINGWCFEKTKGKIPAITDANTINSLDMCLLNALYFNAQWTKEFVIGEDPIYFYCHNQSKILKRDAQMGLYSERCRVPMMFCEGRRLSYAKSNEYTFVEIPYGNGAFAFDILLPEGEGSEDGVYKSIAALSGEKFGSLVSVAQDTEIDLIMPTFKMEYTACTLIDNLQTLGMNRAFSPDADFSGISGRGAFIELISQKTCIEVSEKGTEAAAATMIGLKREYAGNVVRTVSVNRPFIFAIRETGTNTILIIGAKTTFD